MTTKSPMLTLRLDTEQERALQALARQKGLSKSALVRELITAALSEQHKDPRALVKSIINLRENIRLRKPIDVRTLIEEGRD